MLLTRILTILFAGLLFVWTSERSCGQVVGGGDSGGGGKEGDELAALDFQDRWISAIPADGSVLVAPSSVAHGGTVEVRNRDKVLIYGQMVCEVFRKNSEKPDDWIPVKLHGIGPAKVIDGKLIPAGKQATLSGLHWRAFLDGSEGVYKFAFQVIVYRVDVGGHKIDETAQAGEMKHNILIVK